MAEKNEEIVTKAVEWVKRKGYSKVKANVGELEAPTSFTQREGGENGEDAIITPDITAVMRGNKCYFEIAMCRTTSRMSLPNGSCSTASRP